MERKPRVLVLGGPLEYVDRRYLENFQRDYEVHVLDAKDRTETLAKLAPKVASEGPFEAFVCKMGTDAYEPYDATLLHPLTPHCRIIASASAGYNEFDVPWMTANGIWFTNTINAVSEATADMAVLLILATVRNFSLADKRARAGEWKVGLSPTDDTYGKMLGVVGMGSIGKLVVQKARVFGLAGVWYHNRRRLPREEEERLGVVYCKTLEELLAEADILSIHVPLTKETENLVSSRELARMKKGSYLVNTARGGVVDSAALQETLESGQLRRAGIDVFPHEPDIDEWLRSSEKVVLQPHMGGLTVSAFAKSERECLENVRAMFESGKPNSPVNRPESRA